MTACIVLELQAHHYRTEEDYYRAMRKRQEEYLTRISPFTRIMADLTRMMPFRYAIGADGKLVGTVGIVWDGYEDTKKTYDQCQEMIESIARGYFTDHTKGER